MQTSAGRLRIIAIVPTIAGNTGDAVNERQFIKALSRFADVKVYSIVSRNITTKIKLKSSNYIVNMLVRIIFGFYFALIVVLKKPHIVYVRTSFLALPVLVFRKLYNAIVVAKIPAILEDEVPKTRNVLEKVSFTFYKHFLDLIDRFVMSNSDILAVPSLLLYEELAKRRRIKPNTNIIVLPAGIDSEYIEKIKISAPTVVKENVFIAGFVGLLEWWQGVDILIEALHVIKQKCNINSKLRLKVLIVGDGPLRKKIEYMCRKYEIECIITGFVPHEKSLKLMSIMDVLVLPSIRISTTNANIPIKVLEAWALGIPVVTTHHRIYHILGVKDSVHALFCEPEPNSVANAICKLIKDRELYNFIKFNAQNYVKQFDYNKLAKKFIEISINILKMKRYDK